MKMHSKKGFTITELAIVIAVIAILAAVMIPTFGGIGQKAKVTAAQADATAIRNEVFVHCNGEELPAEVVILLNDDFHCLLTNGELGEVAELEDSDFEGDGWYVANKTAADNDAATKAPGTYYYWLPFGDDLDLNDDGEVNNPACVEKMYYKYTVTVPNP